MASNKKGKNMIHKNDTLKNLLYVSVLVFCSTLGYAIGHSLSDQSCQCDENCKCCASCSCSHGEK